MASKVRHILSGGDRLLAAVVSDAVSLAKLGALSLLESVQRRVGRLDPYAAILAEVARQLTFTANLAKTICTREALGEARRQARALWRAVGAILAQLAPHTGGVEARVVETGEGRLVALYPRKCPYCHTKLEHRVEKAPPQGRCKGGITVEAHCPTCGWKLSYRLCIATCGRPLGLTLDTAEPTTKPSKDC